MIIYSVIKYYILECALNAFFDKVNINFSKFDLLDGCRYFKELVYKNEDGIDGVSILHLKNVEIKYIGFASNKLIKITVEFSYSRETRRSSNLYVTRIASIVPGERLVVMRRFLRRW